MNWQISSRQAGFILFTLILGSAVTYMPESPAGRDAWISTVLAAPVGVYVLILIIGTQKMFPGKSMLEVSELVLGSWMGKMVNVLYVGLLFIMAAFYLYDLVVFLHSILLDLSMYYLYALLMLAVSYGVYQGVNAVSRLVELMVWIMPFFLGLAFLIMLICCADFSQLTPVLAEVKPVLVGAFYAANWPFAQASLLIMYLPLVVDLADKQKVIYIWYMVAAVIMVMRSALAVMVVGEGIILLSRFPMFEAFRLIKASDFERIELFFFILVFTTGLLALLFSYQALIMGMQKLFNLKEITPLILSGGIFLIAMSNYMFGSDLEVLLLETMVPFIMLPIQLLYPALIYMAGRIYLKGRGKKASPIG